MLGAYVDGVAQIKVIDRPDFVWCRLRGSTSEVVQAVNESVGLHWDLPILIYRDPLNPAFWKVYGRDISQYSSWDGASYLPPHGDAHSFSASPNTGVDPVWVFKRQYMPLLPHPVISGANGIYIEPDFYYWGGRYYWWPGSGTTSLLGSRPTGALNGAFVTVYLEGSSRTLQTIKGPEFPAWYPPDDASAFISLPSPLQGIPLAAVFLTTGSTRIGWGEIYDLRMPAEALGNELVTGTVVLRNEGAILGSITTLDFVGGLVDASISGTYGRILISGSTGGGGSAILGPGTGSAYYMEVGICVSDGGDYWHVPDGPYVTGSLTVFINGLAQRVGIDYVEVDPSSGTFQYLSSPPTGASHLALWGKLVAGGAIASGTVQVWDEGTPLGSFNTLEFVGNTVGVTASGTHARIFITGTPASFTVPLTGSVVGLDEGATLGSFTRLNFRGAGVAATASGTYLDVSIPGGGGGGGVDQIGVMGQDEGVPLGTGTTVNFVGAGVVATRSGTVIDVNVPGGAGVTPITGTVVGLDEGTTLGSFSRLNFRGPGVVATASGSYLDVNVPGPGTDQIGVVGQDEGVPFGTGTTLNFVGAGVAATRSGTVIEVNVPGGGVGPTGPPGTFGMMGWDEGIPLGTGTILNVTGDGASVSLSGTVLELNIPSASLAPVTGSVVLLDDDALLGSAKEINLRHGLTGWASGSYGVVDVVDYSPMVKHKASASTPDDDFDTGALDAKWTPSKGTLGSVALLSGSTAIYDLTTRQGDMLLQAGNNGQCYFRQDYTLPDARSIVLALSIGGSTAGEGDFVGNSTWLGIALNNDNNGPLTGTYCALFFDAQISGGRIISYQNGSTVAGTAGTGGQVEGILGSRLFLRVVRQGLKYHFFTSQDGIAWIALMSYTAPSAFENVWIFIEGRAAPPAPLPIHAVHWIREGGEGLDPW
jgi:hypothetical protein